jgi:HAD superfamily hydrolase (TIGR01549 family)
MANGKPSFLVFDVDGTIVNNIPMIITLFQEIFQKYAGLTYSREDIVRKFGPPEEQIISSDLSSNRKEAIEHFLHEYEKRHPETGYLSANDFATLRQIGFRLGIFTGKGKVSLGITLRKLGLENAFDIVVSGSDVPRSKPYPDGVDLIVRTTGLDRKRFLYIGDSPEDVSMARSAGIKVVGALWGAIDTMALKKSHPEYLFEEPSLLVRWLARACAET